MMLNHPAGQPTPTAADIQHLHAGFQTQFLTDHLHFIHLRLRKTFGPVPVAAAVIHVRVQHVLENVVTDIVVLFRNLEGPVPALPVEQTKAKEKNQESEIIAHPIFQAGTKRTVDHLVQPLAVPPAVHVRLAQAQRAITQNATEKVRVIDLHVPLIGAIQANAGRLQQPLEVLDLWRLHGTLHQWGPRGLLLVATFGIGLARAGKQHTILPVDYLKTNTIYRGVASGKPPSIGKVAPVLGVRRSRKKSTPSATWLAVILAFSRLRLR